MVTFPTVLTITRIILIPFIGLAVIKYSWFLAIVLFLIAALTDACDGFLARLLKQESALGAFLDPLADKLLIITIAGAFLYSNSLVYNAMVMKLFFIVLVIKEIALMGGTVVALIMKKRFAIRPTALGKVAMVVQVVVLGALFAIVWTGDHTPLLINGLLFVAASFVIASGLQYAMIGLNIVRGES